MDLYSGHPWWIAKNGLLHSYPALDEDVDCDVLVVGGGITGALIADTLAATGMNVVVIDRREAGWGSTAASTALLQYEIDTELQDLATQVGMTNAVLAYRACEQAVHRLHALADEMPDVDFAMADSLYLASRERHVRRLRREGSLRRANGLEVLTLEEPGLREGYGVRAPLGLLTPVAARVDPYQLTHGLLARVNRRKGRVHGRTPLERFRTHRGCVVATTADDRTIRCQHLVLAAGYECQRYLDDRVARNRSTYAFISEPVHETSFSGDLLVWESARPYIYLRTTSDRRLIVGGQDDNMDVPERRDRRMPAKVTQLERRCAQLLPDLSLRRAFAWVGTFAETRDGLPFFGPHPQHGGRVHFAMAYGGNGITYSVIGAQILLDTLRGRRHPCQKLFSFQRLHRE
ncbi:MAG TPA: FAD-dependent oxidoreductase [Xanthomonadaceae bacterium]|jgi:glycine/D-amino acid oxidase-like deaminating enzyme|nr:FAD-dependent oxidoreductase [Xanthomonadaceae bacterium]